MGFIEKMQKKVPCLMSRKFSFITMTILLGVFFIIEVVVGYTTNSMALIADSFHMLSDVASLIVGYLALKYSTRDANRDTYTYGYARAEVLGALVNAVFLVALCFSITIEALKRLVIVEEIENPLLVFCVGAAGLVVNVFGMFLFHQTGHGHSHGAGGGGGGSHGHGHGGGSHSHSHSLQHGHTHGNNGEEQSHGPGSKKKSKPIETSEKENKDNSNENMFSEESASRDSAKDCEQECKTDCEANKTTDSSINLEEKDDARFPKQQPSANQLNIQGVYLHILGDALGSVIVMISATIIIYARGTWTLYVDPSMSIIMVIIILKTSIPLFKETSKILMNSVPHHIDIKDLRERLMRKLPQIKNVHELHVWQLAGEKIIASAHVKFETPEDYDEVAIKIKDFFHNEGIHSTTVQIEYEKRDEIERRGHCMVVCSLDSACDEMMCCKPEHN